MKTQEVKVSTTVNGREFGPFVLPVERVEPTAPDGMTELRNRYTDEEIISLVNRDENSNVGNAARAALRAAVEAGNTDDEQLKGIVLEAARQYEAGETVKRAGASKISKALTRLYADVASGSKEAIKVSRAAQDVYESGDQLGGNKLVMEYFDKVTATA